MHTPANKLLQAAKQLLKTITQLHVTWVKPNLAHELPELQRTAKELGLDLKVLLTAASMTKVNTKPLECWTEDEAYPQLVKLNPQASIIVTVVAPEYRGLGIAKKIRSFLQQRYHSLLTGTGSKSDPSMQRLNKSTGFVPVLTRKQTIIWFWEK